MLRWLVLILCSSCAIDTVPLPELRSGDHDKGAGDYGPPSYQEGDDDGVGGLPECLGAVGSTGELTRLRFERKSPYLGISILRRYVDVGVGESVIYALEEMRVLDEVGACLVMSDAAELEWLNSHHNWGDRAVAAHTGVRYELAMDFDVTPEGAAWHNSLTATEDPVGTLLFDAPTLIATGGPLFCWNCPNHVPLLVNEVATSNATILADDQGDYDPWIEIFNPSSGAVDLGGYALSDDPTDPLRWLFPSGKLLGRHEYLVVWADGQAERALHTSFTLADGGFLQLSAIDLTSGGARKLPATAPDTTLVYDWSTDGYTSGGTPTPGAANP